MKHDIIVIDSRGKVGKTNPNFSGILTRRTLIGFKKLIEGMPLTSHKYLMNQSDYDDISAWSKEDQDK